MPRIFAASRGARSFCTATSCKRTDYNILNRYSNTFLYDSRNLISLVPQGLPGLERMRDAFLSFLFAAEGDEGFALEIENILLADNFNLRGLRAFLPGCR